jgi:cytidylate kinase
MSDIYQVAIDGPSGAGKSTIAKAVARQLGIDYIDTGAMYRTIALYLLRHHIDVEDEKTLQEALDNISVSISYDNGVQHMLLNGEDVTGMIRTQEVSDEASRSSAHPAVRQKLLQLQRGLADTCDVLMDGRDIGTKILPDAGLKIFLTASVDERAKRRYKELEEKGESVSFEEIRSQIEERDYRDTHREVSPLCQAADAVLLDTSDMDLDMVVSAIVNMAKERMNA